MISCIRWFRLFLMVALLSLLSGCAVEVAPSAPPDTEEADFAAFVVEAKAKSKPRMSDEARTYKLLAEDAARRKDLTAALNNYRLALAKYPMWPDVLYNAALLSAEFGDFKSAARHMRRYLVLAPGAKDAADARDKLLVWQHNAGLPPQGN